MLTIDPPAPCATIRSAAATESNCTQRTFCRNTKSQSDASDSRSGRQPARMPPATFTKMSTAPKASTVAGTMAANSASSRRFATSAHARPPRAVTSAVTRSARSATLSTTITAAPASASTSEIASPMPRPPPATIAVFPITSPCIPRTIVRAIRTNSWQCGRERFAPGFRGARCAWRAPRRRVRDDAPTQTRGG